MKTERISKRCARTPYGKDEGSLSYPFPISLKALDRRAGIVACWELIVPEFASPRCKGAFLTSKLNDIIEPD
jgi:hypothetical protein